MQRALGIATEREDSTLGPGDSITCQFTPRLRRGQYHQPTAQFPVLLKTLLGSHCDQIRAKTQATGPCRGAQQEPLLRDSPSARLRHRTDRPGKPRWGTVGKRRAARVALSPSPKHRQDTRTPSRVRGTGCAKPEG